MTIYRKSTSFNQEMELYYYHAHKFMDNGYVETCGIASDEEYRFCAYSVTMVQYETTEDLDGMFPDMEDSTEEEFNKIKSKIKEFETEIYNHKE